MTAKVKSHDSATRSTAVFLVEDHPVLRRGVADLLTQKGYRVCGEAEDGGPVTTANIISARPRVVIMDLSLKTSEGLDLVRQIREAAHCPEVVVFSMHEDPFLVQEAFRLGAKAYVSKRESPEQLLAAIAQALLGRTYLSQSLASVMAARWGARTATVLSEVRLTDREGEIYRLIGQGYRTKEIAAKLFLSPKTVDTYCGQLKWKLGLASTSELHRHAIRHARRT